MSAAAAREYTLCRGQRDGGVCRYGGRRTHIAFGEAYLSFQTRCIRVAYGVTKFCQI